MPKLVSDQDFDPIVKIIEQYPNGIALRDIQTQTTLPRRTLQRRLLHLVQIGRLNVQGKQKGVRYQLNKPEFFYEIEPFRHPKILEVREIEGRYMAISSEAIPIKKAMRQPLSERRSVGYNRDFLEAYEPNKTFYLSEKIRAHLRALGTLPDTTPPTGTYARDLFNRLLIDLSCNSSRLEGNSYSLLETERLVMLGQVTEGKSRLDTQMIINHKAAIEFLVENVSEIGFNRYTIFNLHALLADNLLENKNAIGNLRKIPVGIGGTAYSPLQIPLLVEECFQQILTKAAQIADPFEQGFFAMVHLPYLQAFEDVNKRVSRLAVNIPLIKQNLCPLSFVEVEKRAYVDGILAVYELNQIELLRDVFVWAYQRSSGRYAMVQHSLGEPEPFYLYYRMQLKEVIAYIVRHSFNREQATKFVRQWVAERIPSLDDRLFFIETVETELLSLHEGNIARFRLRPAEFEQWYKRWKV